MTFISRSRQAFHLRKPKSIDIKFLAWVAILIINLAGIPELWSLESSFFGLSPNHR